MREKKDINIEIGGNIQVAREQAGYTQDTLSEMLGMTPNHLSAIERGASGISLEALQRLCRLLGTYGSNQARLKVIEHIGKGTEVMWCQDFKDQPGKYDQTD